MAMRSLLIAPITTIVILHLMSIRFRGVGAFVTTMKRTHSGQGAAAGGANSRQCRRPMMVMAASNSTTTAVPIQSESSMTTSPPPLYVAEGLLAVHKPLTWTSNDVVAYIRGILTRDAKDRGAKEDNNDGNKKKKQWGRRKKQMMKVGHGGTLDPLASGVLVLGVGKGTTLLQSYLEGDKHYVAACELGYETDTLDAEGKLVKTAPWDHVKDMTAVKEIEPKFTGKIEQVPPLYSAIRIDGKRLYEIARKDSAKTAEDVEIPKREVEIHSLQVGTGFDDSVIRSGVVDGPRYREEAQALEEKAAAEAKAIAEAAAATAAAAENDANANDNTKEDGASSDDEVGGGKGKKRKRRNNKKNNKKDNKKNLFNEETVPSIQPDSGILELPRFSLSVQCGGGTYIRSLVRDIGYELDTVATMTGLVRTKQGPFVLEDILMKEDWTADKIYEAIQRSKEKYDISLK